MQSYLGLFSIARTAFPCGSRAGFQSTPGSACTSAAEACHCRRERVAFAVQSTGTFLALGLGCYALYGRPFLEEAFLYHSRRRDPRHNFSPFFYPTYLDLGLENPPKTLARFEQSPSNDNNKAGC